MESIVIHYDIKNGLYFLMAHDSITNRVVGHPVPTLSHVEMQAQAIIDYRNTSIEVYYSRSVLYGIAKEKGVKVWSKDIK